MPTLDFKGKQFVHSHHLSVPFRALEVEAGKSLSKKPGLDDNLIIHGDNLHALKALLPKYAGKVKCIYIDPPYNTGNEGWCYNDNVNSPQMKEWLAKSANPVDKEDLLRHDKWLCMMWPRLQLLHELLADDGVIFVSIDDNELYNLRCILDEIFIDKNWVGTIVWKNATDNNPTNISIEHEYVLCFAKRKESLAKVWKSAASEVKNKLIQIGQQFTQKYKEQPVLQKAYNDWFRENKPYLWPLDRYKYIDNGGVYDIVRQIKDHALAWLLATSEALFVDKLKNGKIILKLLATPYLGLNWDMRDTREVYKKHKEDPAVSWDKNIFQPQYKSNYTGLEEDVAAYINASEAVKWWHRLGVKGTEYAVQGWKKDRIYPDFLMLNRDDKYLFIETKGNHLKNADSEYKAKVFKYLNDYNALTVGEFKLMAGSKEISFHLVYEEAWKEDLIKLAA